jgi:hypothetical protein
MIIFPKSYFKLGCVFAVLLNYNSLSINLSRLIFEMEFTHERQ